MSWVLQTSFTVGNNYAVFLAGPNNVYLPTFKERFQPNVDKHTSPMDPMGILYICISLNIYIYIYIYTVMICPDSQICQPGTTHSKPSPPHPSIVVDKSAILVEMSLDVVRWSSTAVFTRVLHQKECLEENLSESTLKTAQWMMLEST